MKIAVDLDRCYKSGECYYNHPRMFKMGEDGYPIVLVEEINSAELRRHADEAIEVCPAVALRLE